MDKKRILTDEQKQKVRGVIARAMTPGDKDPDEVIKEDFKGDENAYLLTMARWHNIPLDEIDED